MKILVFDTDLSGHHLEYIHHLLMKAKHSSDDYIFYIPECFNIVKDKGMDWSYGENVEFSFFDPKDVNNQSSILKKSWNKCKLLEEAIKKFDITHIFLITLMGFIPFLPFFLTSKIKVSGIIYQIYLYRWNTSSVVQKMMDIIKFLTLRFCRQIDKIYVLNDRMSAEALNKYYKTNKFIYLTDPYLQIDKDEFVNRKSLNIPDDSEVFLHLGDMRERKGTIDLLYAIKKCSSNELISKTFIFAGKVNKEIKDDFYKLINSLPKECDIRIYDQFCKYEFFGALCSLTDYILIPYKQTGQSTGIIGYAAQFQKPVFGPNDGLVGKLIQEFKLGYTDIINPTTIYNFIINKNKVNKITSDYLFINTVEKFTTTIIFN